MAKLFTRPVFRHDCDQCRFITHCEPREGAAFDLYICEESVIARDGDNGEDYHTMPESLLALFPDDMETTLGRAFHIIRLYRERRLIKLVA